ncbi:MAG: (Fe-S)-binding protein, partial [Bacteroidetes bacterium]|nr:(Fe-S)-binding protein [Bacteroidota bacterium]
MSTSKQKALDLLTNNLDSRLITYLNSCVHCGLCAESCHYYLSNNEYLPVQKVELLSQIYSRYNTILGRIIPKFVNAKDFDDVTINKMIDVFFGSCTMCGRCSINCSIGIDIPLLVRIARSMLVELELVPAGLQSTVDAAVNTGNNMAIPREEFVDTLEWLEEDLSLEVNDETAVIPMDKVGKN